MIRFVDMTDALELDDGQAFAWFDTVTDTFLVFAGEQVWHEWDEFADAWWDEPSDTHRIERFWGLFPPFHKN